MQRKPTLKSLSAGFLALAGAALLTGCGVLQYHASYPGGLVFVGHPSGAFGASYHRVFMWRAPGDASPMPDFSLVIDGERYPIAEWTPETMQALGGMPEFGGLMDTAGYHLQYRFEDGRLDHFSLNSPHPSMDRTGTLGRIHLQAGQGQPFLLPVSGRDLTKLAGKPQRVRRNLAN